MRALRASRPGQAYRALDSITYLDLFDYGGYHFANLKTDHQLALLPKVADFILADNVSHFGDWSGMLFVQSVAATSRFYSACNLLQKDSIYQFVSYISIWRLERHECGLFKDYVESFLEKWKAGYYARKE